MFNNLRAIWHHGTANKFRDREDYRKCIEYSEKAIQQKPHSFILARSYALIGEAEYYLNNYKRAVDFFETALEQILIDESMWSEKYKSTFVYDITVFIQKCNKKIAKSKNET